MICVRISEVRGAMRLLLISDDLTGALDSAAVFAGRGRKVVCALDAEALTLAADHAPEVLAISLNTRELSQSASQARLATLLTALKNMPAWRDAVLFKKIDSRLKGHIAADLALLSPLRSERLICPAIPRLGRVVRDGALQGAGVVRPLPVASIIAQPEALYIDAETEADLDAAIDAIDPSQTLFVGASGLAGALARKLVPRAGFVQVPVMQRPAIFAIGSRDPVTMAQLARFDTISAPNGHVPPITPAALSVLQMTKAQPPVTAADAGATFAEGIATVLRCHQMKTLMACGGETAVAILRALDARVLHLETEIMAGVAVSRLLDGMPGLRFVSKSGGFGEPETLQDLAEIIQTATT